MITIDVEQGTDDWHKIRVGKVTASRMGDVMAKTKSGPSALRQTYLGQLVAEILTGEPTPSYTNDAMRWGTENEPLARSLYELQVGQEVKEVGFVLHPDIDRTGASPDGLVGSDGLVEIKSPNSSTHIATLTGEGIKRQYLLQMQWQMACTGRAWCDFVSFDPRMPPELQLHIERIDRDSDLIKDMALEVHAFLRDLDRTVAQLRERIEILSAA